VANGNGNGNGQFDIGVGDPLMAHPAVNKPTENIRTVAANGLSAAPYFPLLAGGDGEDRR
jgi:hypothetical protein